MLNYELEIRKVLSDIYGQNANEIDVNESLESIGFDSLNYINLLVAIEDTFKITIPEELVNIENFFNIYNINQMLKNLEIVNTKLQFPEYNYSGGRMLIKEYCALEVNNHNKWNKFDLRNIYSEITNNNSNLLKNFFIFNNLNRKGFNTYRHINNSDRKTFILITKIICDKEYDTILNCTVSGKGKIWVNNKCVLVYDTYSGTTELAYCLLHYGVNTITVEQFQPSFEQITNIQILDYKQEEQYENFSLKSCGTDISNCDLKSVTDNCYLPKDEFRMLFYQSGYSYQDAYTIEVYNTKFNKLDKLEGKINSVKTINIAKYRPSNNNDLNHIMVKCLFKKVNCSEIFEKYIFLILTELETVAIPLMKEASAYANNAPEIVKNSVLGKVQRLQTALEWKNYDRIYWWLHELIFYKNDTIQKLRNDLYSEGKKEVFIHSDLDDTYVKILISLPEKYDANKYYPAIFALSTSHEGYFGWNVDIKNCITFDLTGRGYTGGSYIGEASIMELLDWCLQNFKVDKKKMYFAGFSNGGFAVWSLAQNHPSLPAAIYPLASIPNEDQIDNISNINCYQIFSKDDYLFNNRNSNLNLGYDNYKEYNMNQMLHIHFNPYLYSKIILDQITNCSKAEECKHIDFTTYRMRHNKYEWIEILDFYGSKCNVRADIVSPGLITVCTKNINVLKLTCPNCINSKNFSIVIDGVRLVMMNIIINEIMLEKKDTWKVMDFNSNIDINYRKGTGLLDVYMGAMRILAPNKDKIENSVASSLSSPFSNGLDSDVYVNYPIYNTIPDDNIFEKYNWILFGLKQLNDQLRTQILDDCIVRCSNEGYYINGIKTVTDYVSMQILANPLNRENSILLIESNCTDLLKKHILLRKVVLPTYLSGLHKYWNCEALIFNGKNYLVVK